MRHNSKFYRLTSTLVAITMLLQLFVPITIVPAAIMPPATAVQAAPPANPQSATPNSPLIMNNAPISLARTQSGASSDETIVVSYIVTNNQPPTLDTAIPEGTTITDTVAILSVLDPAEDMNTLHDSELVMTLTNGTLVDANGASQNGNTLTWTLGDILPMESKLITMTVAAPAAAPDFVELDDGAQATAVLWNNPIATTARPALVIPDAVDPTFVAATVDADSADEDMLWAASAFTQDPLAAFAMVQNFAFDPYKGSLRGTRGTLWGEAGNSLDQSSALIAMLRAAGVPARYRHGTLDIADAQTLLASMFDAPQGVAGYLPADAVLADPLNDPALIALAQDHWWVEAYLPGIGWTDLDPTFPGTAVGDIIATPGTNDQIAEIPDTLRHKVHMELEIEQYNSFPIGGTNLSTSIPLTATFAAAQVASKAVILGHLLETDDPGGLVFTSVEHTYTPYFGINGDQYVELGQPFSDLMTSFPLASHFTTAAWIHFELTDADGDSQTFTREVKDTIGIATRLLGGVLDITSPADNAPFISSEDAFVADFLPNLVRNTDYAARHEAELQYDVLELAQETEALPKDDLTTPEAEEQAGEARYRGEIARALLYSLSGLDFAFRADSLTDTLAENLRVNLFYDKSRVIVMHGASVEDSAVRTVDLRNTDARAIAAPGQAETAVRTAQWVKAVAESYFEGDALRDASGLEPITTARIFEEAQAQGIDFVYVTPDQLDLLDLYLPDPDAYGHAAAALIAGQEVLIPTEPVLIDGEYRLGWWAIDPETGTAVSVLDNGLHGALMEYATMIKKIVGKLKKTWKNFGKSVDQLWNDCLVDNVVPALQGGPAGSGGACLDNWKPPSGGPLRAPLAPSTPWYYLPDHLCPTDNCGLEQFLLDGYDHANMPLPETIFQYADDQLPAQAYIGQLISVTDNGGGGDPDFTLTPSGAGTITPLQTYGLDIAASANFDGDLEVWTYAPDGWSVGFVDDTQTQVQIVAPENTPAGSYTILVTGQSSDNRTLIATAEHIVTVPTQESIVLAYETEPNITVNLGAPAYDAVSNQTNDGEAEIPDSAFKLRVANFSAITKTITLSVSGAPAGWVVLDGAEQTTTSVTLAPFSRTRAGLYVKPDTFPAPGTSFTMDVVADDGGSLSDSVSISWTMPGQAHNFLQIEPQTMYVAVDGNVEFDLSMTNVGNASGSFPITATVPISTWNVSGLPADMTLAVDESSSATGTLNIVGGTLGREYPLVFASSAPGSYTQYELATAVVVSPLTGPIFGASESCTVGSDALSAAFESLAFAVSDLENSCNAGSCNLDLRDTAVTAANNAANYARLASPFVSEYANLETIAADLAGHTDDADIMADLTAMSTAVTVLSAELCVIEEHAPSAKFTPYVDAILLGDSVGFSLDVTNEGTIATTYAITVTGLPGGSQFFNETIAPGATLNLPVNDTPAAMGAFDVEAAVTYADLTDTAVARLNVVDKFVQITQVRATPDFVETGVSSTDLSVEIANISGVAQDGNARTAVLAPDGSTEWTQDIPLTALAGNPRWYDLATVDTSGWAEGTYTVTVNFLDGTGALIPDGSGYGYFNVGQGLVASQAVTPAIVAPGDITVTTIITTELTQVSLPPDPLGPVNSDQLSVNSEPVYPAAFLATLPAVDSDSLLNGLPLAELYAEWEQQFTIHNSQFTTHNSHPLTPVYAPPITETTETAVAEPASQVTIHNPQLTINSVFTRTEQDDTAVVYAGTWSNVNVNKASGGSYLRADTAGETAELSFTGSWLNIGFIGSSFGGYAEIFIDGVSQGTVDLYRRDETAVSYLYDGLTNAPHTVTVAALDTSNPNSSNDYVQLDYFDAWDGSALPDGTFEQNDARVIRSGGWFTHTDAIASGGSYIRSSSGTAWFPFSGDSFNYQAINRSGGVQHTRLYVDGQFLTDLSTFNYDTITNTYSFNGFGSGPHILQINAYRNDTNFDAVTTPGTAPFTDPNPVGSYTRYEEDNPAWLYNGVPFTQTATSWVRYNFSAAALSSDGQAVRSSTAGDTAVITVNGQWIALGFAGDSSSGSADIYLDGVYQRTVNLYRNSDSVTSEFFPALSAGNHTISVTVVGDGRVWIDYADVWDGTTLPDGTFEDFPGRFYLNTPWSRITDADAVNGSYLRANSGTVWFPFTGDSVSYRAFAYSGADDGRLYLDDQFIGTLDLFNSTDISRTFSLAPAGLGAGVHLLRLEQHHGNVTLEDFATPGSAPFYNPPAPTGVIRYEEDDPALRYNGVPLTQTVSSWGGSYAELYASDGYYARSSNPGDNVSLTFDGTWVGIGFLTWRTRGIADVYLDGVLIDNVDLFTHSEDSKSVYYDGLTAGTHTISVTVSGSSHPNATDTRIAVDYFDVWDGTAEADGVFEETDRSRIFYSLGWTYNSEAAASGGGYADTSLSSDNTAWFPFTGDSVSFQAWARRDTHEMEIKIDGVSYGRFDIFADVPVTRTFSFDGLGAGPHIMEINSYRADLTLDNFATPGTAPFYTPPPAPTGIIRYEEDNPALLYNGYPFEQTEYCFLNCWFMSWWRSSSDAYVAESRQPGDWVELEFFGSWAGVGFGVGGSGGIAEVFIDGVSQGTVDLSVGQDVKSVYYGDLITGTHTISVTSLSGNLYLDFFDVWDGTPMDDGWFDANLNEHDGPYYYTALDSWYTQEPATFHERIAFAREKDVVSRATISYNTHMWFAFTGNDLEFLPVQKAGDTVELFIDGVSQGVIDLTAEYSEQPFAYYYTNLGNGPHVVRVNAVDGPYIDAFQVNPPDLLPYTPQVEWMSPAPTDIYTDTYPSGGVVSSAAIGDLEGDGLVEIVLPAANGQLYVYRGDGQDTGDGDPILWQSDLVGAGAEPTLVDLDGDGSAEIIVMGTEGTAAFHADGSVYWFTDAIKSEVENVGWAGSSVGNLDLEPGPEIVLAAINDAMYVLDHDGTVLFSEPTGDLPAIPTLADVTGDGILDIIFAQDHTITAFDAFNGFNIIWSYTHTYPGFYGQAFGSPAVVDVDGKQPGGDDGPEIVINWGHYVDVLDADGTFLWNYYLGDDNYRRPSPVTVADVDGDNEIEILTASAFQSGFLVLHHLLAALNADGSLLWSQEMGDTTASASGVATQDLDGDGVWEVLWNGFVEGFTIMDGPTGEKVFNETFTESGTVVDYPTLGDVDGDGYAEVVASGMNGMFVIGYDAVWGDSRPLWNQHNYHVTNINDDWSVPINEPNAWEIHNTYRTQTPDRNPTPVYQVSITYTAGINNVTVLTDTASMPLTATPPTYTWSYSQEWYNPVITTTFDSLLTDMQPGEVRMVSQGTQIGYELPSGINYLTLPPMYVAAPRIVTMSPAEATAAAGSTAVFDIALFNPSPTSGDVYALAVSGIPDGWASYPASVNLAAGETATVTLSVAIPAGAAADTLPLIVDVTNAASGTDQTMASLTIIAGVEAAITPETQTAVPNQPVTYTLTITNYESIGQTFTLTATGLADVTLPPTVVVGPGGVVTIEIVVSSGNPGPQPFTIIVVGDNGAETSVDAVLDLSDAADVALTLEPDPIVAGPGSTAVLTATVTNLGSLADSFNLSVTAPAGWTAELQQNGAAVSQVNLPPNLFNSNELLLLVTPDAGAAMGDYEVEVTAVSQTDPAVTAVVTGTVQIGGHGVQVSIISGPTTLDPRDVGVWDVRITNTGSAADTFDLQAAGLIAAAGQFSADSVSLNPGQSQTVQLTADNLDFVLPQTYPVIAAAASQGNPQIQHQDMTDVTFIEYEAVEVAWQPPTQTITDSLTAQFTLVFTNTGNIPTEYQLDVSAPGGAVNTLGLNSLLLPVHSSGRVLVGVTVPSDGTYTIEAVVSSTSSGVSGSDTAVLIVEEAFPNKVYIPIMIKN